jgi:hypothetical protein
MYYPIYKGNKKNTGNAASLQLSNDKKSFWLKAINQFSWDENKPGQNKASFKENAKNPNKSINVKLNITELGGIVHALKNWEPWDVVHKYEKGDQTITTHIKVGVWERKEHPKGNAMSIGISQGEKKFSVALEKGEMEVVRIFMENAVFEMLKAGSVDSDE